MQINENAVSRHPHLHTAGTVCDHAQLRGAASTRLVSVEAEDLSGLLLFSEVAKAQLAHAVAAPRVHSRVSDRHHVLAARRDPPHSLRTQGMFTQITMHPVNCAIPSWLARLMP